MKPTTLLSGALFLFLAPLSQAKVVDLFVSGGQSNANFNKKAFGVGIENVVTQSSVFSNAEVVKTAMGGTPIIKWMDDDGNPQKFYHAHFSIIQVMVDRANWINAFRKSKNEVTSCGSGVLLVSGRSRIET